MNLTKREHFTLELAKAVLSNTAAISMASEHLARNAVADADAILAELERVATVPDDGWIEHDPSGPVPDKYSAVRFKDGQKFLSPLCEWTESCWSHGHPSASYHITHYKP